ncbi:MAG: hypothetical protein NZ521_05125, partial [Flammeovirgaceae bacterium]|nr:hypothetical protein [Flammeovirgaceae bacterium]
EGEILDEQGKKIVKFSSYHNGMGSFSLTPQPQQKYTARLTAPYPLETVFQLPEALQRGYTLGVEQQTKEKIVLTVKTTEKETLYLVAQMRGQWLDDKKIQANKEITLVELDTKDYPMGVVQFTLLDSKGIERAERLAFINPHKQLNISLTTDKEKYLPREKVTLTIRTTDERGIGIPAQLSLAVVDDKLLSFADDKQGHILAKLLLEPDLKGTIHEPNFYFDAREEKAPQALDLLMMTQGWRKFTWQEIQSEKHYFPSYKAEKAILKGVVMNEKKAIQGAKVSLSDTTYRIAVVTDAEGKFVISDYDLYAPIYIQAEKPGYSFESVFLNDYSEEITIQTQTIVLYTKPRNGDVENAINIRNKRTTKKAAELSFATEGSPQEYALAQEPSTPATTPEVIDISHKVQVAIRDEFMPVKEHKKAENEFTPVRETQYYRARVFPKIIYSEKDMNPETRTDFRTTIYWQGNIQTDRNGKTTVAFYNNDDITTFRITVEGIGVEGSVGRKELTYFTQQPFSMNIKIPVEMTMGDVVSLPLTLHNSTNEKISGSLDIKLPKAWKPLSNARHASNAIFLHPQQATTIYLQYEVLNYPGKDTVRIAFESGKHRDAFVQEINIAPKGFPVSIAISGQEKSAKATFALQKVVDGTLQASFTVYPSVMSDLLAGVESILREPYGCFEQTSASCYPNIMVLQYLKANEVKNPTLFAQAHDLIDKGYKRLITFETKENGYEWFGGTPPHEALTAYGLMEFNDMSQVYASIDRNMVQRTANWLFSRKDGKSGFLQSDKALDSFGRASQDVTNAYIVYALSEAGYILEIKDELEKAYQVAQTNQDPYQMALVANALFNVKDARSEQFLVPLLKKQKQEGFWEGTTHSITYSTGLALRLETTALTLLAAMKAKDADKKRIGDGIKYLISQRS